MTTATTDAREAPPLLQKMAKIAERQQQLERQIILAQAETGLTRTRLALALTEALAGRDTAKAERARALVEVHRTRACAHPRRRNRLSRRLDAALARLGPVGGSVVVARSGLHGDGATPRSRLGALRQFVARVRQGARQDGEAPVLVDAEAYRRLYPDIAASRVSPAAHYILAGADEGRIAHPLFDADFYRERNGAGMGALGLSALEHYVRIGAASGADPHPLFSGDHYVAQRSDLAQAGVNPLAHYLSTGWREGLDPHPLFDTAYYLAQAGADAHAGPALVHYLQFGWRQGLKPHPLVDPAWYLAQNPDVAEAGLEPLSHFVRSGAAEGRDPSGWFSTAAHREARGGALASGVNPLVDYLQGGAWAVDSAGPGLITSAYLAAHPEIAALGLTPLEHWARQAG